jgi:CBS domain-containing protein
MSIQSLTASSSAALLTCAPGDLLTTAVSRLVSAAANAIAVTGSSGQLVGILTDHDIVRAINARQGALGKGLVEDWMTRPVITVTPETRLATALALMGQHRIRHVVAVDGSGQPIAIVSIRDLLAKLHEFDEIEINVLRDVAVARR